MVLTRCPFPTKKDTLHRYTDAPSREGYGLASFANSDGTNLTFFLRSCECDPSHFTFPLGEGGPRSGG